MQVTFSSSEFFGDFALYSTQYIPDLSVFTHTFQIISALQGKTMAEEPIVPVEDTPNPNAIDITSNKDGGVLKEIKAAGTGDSSPQKGDTVIVHYVGRLLDGSQFDSSRDRGDKFEFSLGKGSVIKAWDCGVATMKRGEVAMLTCRADYAYGEQGSPPKIPPNATLVFEVELFDWKGEDLSKKKDGGILRSTIIPGIGYTTPNEGATCDIRMIGSYNGVTFEDRQLTFIMGEGSEVGVVDGVELAVKMFKQGEKSRLKIAAKYAYGDAGNTELSIPPGADLEYQVMLHKFEKCKESWEMDDPEKLEQAEMKKEKGTNFFKQSKLTLACRYYNAAVSLLKSDANPPDTDASPADDASVTRSAVLLACHLNLAACSLKTDDHHAVCKHCDAALALQPGNVKALFRRGSARLCMNDFEAAITDFRAVLGADPENKAAKNKIVLASQKLREIHAREKFTYTKMFKQMAEPSMEVDEKSKDDEVATTPLDPTPVPPAAETVQA